MRCDAKRSLSLNFFLIDFSRANLGMHWHQALMLRCTCPSSGGSPALWQLFVRFLSTFPKLSVYRNLCAFSTVFFSVLLFIFVFFFFVISFENVRLVIQQIPSLSFLQCLLFPFLLLLLLNTYIHASHLSCSMSFHSPLGTFPLAPCLIICFLNAIFYVAPFWFVSPCRVFFTCRISCSRLLFATFHTCFLVFFFLRFCHCFFFSIRCSVIYVQQFQALKVILAVVDLLA